MWRCSALALLLLAGTASAQAPDWTAVAGEVTIQVISENEDGSPRETTAWLAVVDDEGFIRTRRTRWGANMNRSPDVTLRIAGRDYALRSAPVADGELVKRVHDVFGEKYGFPNYPLAILRPFLGSYRVYRLAARSE